MNLMKSNPPNIIFLMTDQHRWNALGCANPLVQTPNLDRLAASGIRFDQAICNAPMCVPSRYSMMTGLYPSQNGVLHNRHFIPRDEDLPVPMMPERLRRAGYQTAGFGKTHWYLGSRLQPAGSNTVTSRRGFEVRAQARDLDPNNVQPGALVMQDEDPEAWAALIAETREFGGGGEGVKGYLGCTSRVGPERHREGWLTRKCLDFLEGGRQADRPLFLYLSFDFPHAGFNVPAGYEERYNLDDIPDSACPPWETEPEGHAAPDRRTAEWIHLTSEQRRRSTLRYFALCTYVDELFGQVLDRLRDDGVLDNSLIVFTSDHGEMLGDRGFRFSKYCMYEGSVRVPIILAGSVVEAGRRGTVDSRPAELIDILPTLLDAAGIEQPPTLPGLSLLGSATREGSFCEMHGSGYEIAETDLGKNWLSGTFVLQAPTLMWRTPEWKLILHTPGPASSVLDNQTECLGELYDLRNDPMEWTNRYNDPNCEAIREALTHRLLEFSNRLQVTDPSH